jgi:hypothetical protein
MKVFYDRIHITPGCARVYADYVTKRLLKTVPALQKPRPTPAQELPSDRSR